MVADDACSAVKADLEAGSFTNYTIGDLVYYIENEDKFDGGNAYIFLKDPTRDPIQGVNGGVIYTKRGCTVGAFGDSPTVRDNIYKDIVAILTATNRGYKLIRARDKMWSQNQFTIPLEVSMLL